MQLNKDEAYGIKIPLNSERKRATVAYQRGDGYRIYCKGAPEVVLNFCSQYIGEGGQIMDMTDEFKANVLQIQSQYAKKTLRTLLTTYRDVSKDEYDQIMSQSPEE